MYYMMEYHRYSLPFVHGNHIHVYTCTGVSENSRSEFMIHLHYLCTKLRISCIQTHFWRRALIVCSINAHTLNFLPGPQLCVAYIKASYNFCLELYSIHSYLNVICASFASELEFGCYRTIYNTNGIAITSVLVAASVDDSILLPA